MKAFLKDVAGCSKLALLPLPFVLIASGIGGTVASSIITKQDIDAAYSDFRNNEIVQEYIAHEADILEKQYQEGQISSPDYLRQKDYIKSDDFIYKLIHANDEMKELAQQDTSARAQIFYIIPSLLSFFGGALSATAMYTNSFSKFYSDEKKYKLLIESAKSDFEEAKELKESSKNSKLLKKKEKEVEEYTEELV